MQRIKILLYEMQYLLCNSIIAHIPIWYLRKLLYCMQGMKIGKNSRILMKAIVISPKRIVIGERTIINEKCLLDGRGTIIIKDDVSISHFTKIVTGSHDIHSDRFQYITKPVIIENYVFIGCAAIILGGSHLEKKCVIAAGSVCKNGRYKQDGLYSGVPAAYVTKRNLQGEYQLGDWKPWMI